MPGVGAYLVLPALRADDARLLDVLRGVEVGFAGGETTDIFTGGLQGLGLGIDGERRRRRDVAGPGGQWRGMLMDNCADQRLAPGERQSRYVPTMHHKKGDGREASPCIH
jgi:hypothetical protein